MPSNGQPMRGATQLQRGKTLIRPERYQKPTPLLTGHKERETFDPWVLFSRIITFWAPNFLLAKMGKSDSGMQQAWREKIALCFLIALVGGVVAFFTIGFQTLLCPPQEATNQNLYIPYNDPGFRGSVIGIQGWQFNMTQSKPTENVNFYELATVSGTDITNYFPHGNNIVACQNPALNKYLAVTFDPCVTNNGFNGCPLQPFNPVTLQQYGLVNTSRQVGFDWVQLGNQALRNYLVIDGNVLNFDPYINANPRPIVGDIVDYAIRSVLTNTHPNGGKDATKVFFRQNDLKLAVNCLVEKYYAGHIDKATPSCFVASVVLLVSLTVVLGIVFARFIMALVFSWFLSWRLAKPPPKVRKSMVSPQVLPGNNYEMANRAAPWAQRNDSGNFVKTITWSDIGNDLFTVMLVTCYSEGEASIRNTVESLAVTAYPDERKLLFIIADGQITGHGNDKSTPDICIDMMELDPTFHDPKPQSYIAVAQGSKQHNMAKVYAGHFCHKGHRVPMITVVKWGTPEEQGKAKPGNRGKRDSQLILMNFFSRVTYNDRMTSLDYDLFTKIHHLMGVTPDFFEIVLMVDADTKVYPDSLRLLINCMINDNLIMGLCGETKIANKRDSWVTGIQVYEYYISHHLGKAFESIFGGVTCLPGCFCILKARKGDDDWVPIITKPEIVQEYSQNVVDTLHQKNLLLLGEDRFLTTLMLRNFPHRKMMFMPQAICKTVVPDEFRVLLSQRRRWINSTIHNLLELVLVRNLCGTFCFSMQFVVFLDLIGTVSLPVALALTFVLIISLALTPITSVSSAIPLALLVIVLFSPAILILMTSRKLVYVMWMFVYLLALPVWNLVLPVYAYWHFDDFSWGETRKVTGETKGDDHGKKEGLFDASKVPMKRWEDWERQRVRKAKRRERQRATIASAAHLQHQVIPGDDDSRTHLFSQNSNYEEYSDIGDDLGPPQQPYDYHNGIGYAPPMPPPPQTQQPQQYYQAQSQQQAYPPYQQYQQPPLRYQEPYYQQHQQPQYQEPRYPQQQYESRYNQPPY
ncbi:uncharacterized protein VTP21DRAFT_11446 [Calcarisporiella thermophila]|uniref:uncharacterized protein n=1 Tax=Calcarisporiella thermophila TaxID=911321 RepID=UPI003743E7DE